jgi:alkylhydroperoxidase family enzyme
MLKADARTVNAVRTGAPIAESKVNALVALTRELVAARGHAREQTIDVFLAAGYTAPQVLEVLVGIALKTISNYLDHINPTEIDAPFAAEREPAAS